MYSTMTSKGQITIPKDIRDKVKLKPGDKVFWAVVNKHVELWPKNGTLDDFAGMFYDPDRKPLTDEELEDAIGDAMADAGLGKPLPPE